MSGALQKSGIIEYAGANTPGWISNIGITLAAGVLTITDAQGAALTDANPGWVTVPSATAGQMVTLKVTSGGSFNDDDHASSSLTNFGFGITETASWGNVMPHFLYVVNRANSDIDGVDGSSVFALARDFTMPNTPSAANNIGDTGAIAVTDDQTSILIMQNVTVANYTSLNAQMVGGLKMTWDTATDDWTVFPLDRKSGIGETVINAIFADIYSFPQAQNGAASGSFIHANGGTAPIFSSEIFNYRISRNGSLRVIVGFSGDAGTDGSGAVDTRVSLPYASVVSSSRVSGLLFVDEQTNNEHFGAAEVNGSLAYFTIVETGGGTAQNGDFANGERQIVGSFDYWAY